MPWRVRRTAAGAEIGGEVSAAEAGAFRADLAVLAAMLPAPARLDLDAGEAVAAAVDGVRALLVGRRLILVEAPQMLAHTLYKVGMLADPRLALERPREDEGTTAN